MAIDKITATGLGDGGVSTADLADGAVTAAKLDAAAVTPAAVSDTPNTSTGGLTLPAGTTAQRPSSADTGESRYNTTSGSLEFYDGTTWISTNLIPSITSITGNVYSTLASNLVFAVTETTDKISIIFKEGSTTIATLSDQTVSSGSVTVAVPSAVYGQSVGDSIVITITNSDGTPSGNSITKTVVALPTGGTITTTGNYRVHSFTSSGNLVVSTGFPTTSISYAMSAGGGGGGGGRVDSSLGGAGGGGGGHLNGTTNIAGNTTYPIVIGAGGAGDPLNATSAADNGSNTTGFSLTAIGGGGGGSRNGVEAGSAGGSGGGSTGTNTTSGGAGTSGQGNRGGNQTTADWGATGGGGKGNPGADASGMASTAGGSGTTVTLTGSSIVMSGGGGGGGSNVGSGGVVTPGTGNASGGTGGTGNTAGTGGDAPINQGGGGGGSMNGNVANVTVTRGGNGGSGRVIIRYDVTAL